MRMISEDIYLETREKQAQGSNTSEFKRLYAPREGAPKSDPLVRNLRKTAKRYGLGYELTDRGKEVLAELGWGSGKAAVERMLCEELNMKVWSCQACYLFHNFTGGEPWKHWRA